MKKRPRTRGRIGQLAGSTNACRPRNDVSRTSMHQRPRRRSLIRKRSNRRGKKVKPVVLRSSLTTREAAASSSPCSTLLPPVHIKAKGSPTPRAPPPRLHPRKFRESETLARIKQNIKDRITARNISTCGQQSFSFVEAFRKIDKDNDGTLSKQELRKAVGPKYMDLGLKDSDVDRLYREFDRDGDGGIEFPEFVTALHDIDIPDVPFGEVIYRSTSNGINELERRIAQDPGALNERGKKDPIFGRPRLSQSAVQKRKTMPLPVSPMKRKPRSTGRSRDSKADSHVRLLSKSRTLPVISPPPPGPLVTWRNSETMLSQRSGGAASSRSIWGLQGLQQAPISPIKRSACEAKKSRSGGGFAPSSSQPTLHMTSMGRGHFSGRRMFDRSASSHMLSSSVKLSDPASTQQLKWSPSKKRTIDFYAPKFQKTQAERDDNYWRRQTAKLQGRSKSRHRFLKSISAIQEGEIRVATRNASKACLFSQQAVRQRRGSMQGSSPVW